MSATGFHPEPSAKAPWTRTMVLTVAYAGDDTAKAAPVRRARIKRFMLQLRKIAPPRCLPWRGTAPTVTAGNYSRDLRLAEWIPGHFAPQHCAMSALPPKADIAESDWHVRFVPMAGAGSFDTLMTPTCE